MRSAPPARPVIAIGGVGGSGTRLIAQVVAALGWDLGDDLNEATDNLWFTLLFKRRELWEPAGDEFTRAATAFRAVMSGQRLDAGAEAWIRGLTGDRLQHDRAWLEQRAESLLKAASAARPSNRPWGWKEPNTHVFVDRLADAYPDMKYIHVVRNGLDMAHGPNQNQLALWGPMFLGSAPEPGPRASLRYWCAVQRRMAGIVRDLPGRVMMLNFDALCAAPEPHLEALIDFVGHPADRAAVASLRSLIRVPTSIGRFKPHGLGMFDASDIAFVKAQGFDVEIGHREAGA